MDVNPSKELDVTRLREAIEWSEQRLRPFRAQSLRALQRYAGQNYGAGGSDDYSAELPLFRVAMDIYLRELVPKTPRVLVVTGNLGLRAQAVEFEHALNQLLQEIDFGRTLRRAVMSALVGVGVIKSGVTPSALGEAAGYLHDAGQVFADHVLFEDYFIDMSAEHLEHIDFCGDVYRMPIQDILESGLFKGVSRQDLAASADIMERRDRERSSALSNEGAMPAPQYHKRAELMDVWLPRDNLMITILREGPDKALRTIEWEGPERGPYRRLAFSVVVGNLLGSPPALQLLDMHDAAERIFGQLVDQALRQKTVGLASGMAAADGTAATVLDLEDGQFGTCANPGDVREFTFGGADQGNLQFLGWLRQMFSYVGGNIDAMGGLRSQAPTLGQERLLKGSSSTAIEDMQQDVFDFARDVIRDLGFYLYTDPVRTMRLTKQVGGDAHFGFDWGPDKREADFYEYNLDIEPFSVVGRSPGERLRTLIEMVTQVMAPLQPQLQQAGAALDAEEFMRIIARYSDLPELANILTKAGSPMEAGGPTTRPVQAPITRRESVRRSEAAEPSPEDLISAGMGAPRRGGTTA